MTQFHRMKVLVSILTSSRADLAKLSYSSVIGQEKHTLDYDIRIVVNTKTPGYLDKVRIEFQNEKCQVVETESNGYPGKGHNSVLRLFASSIYDYCILLDGDDFLYPRAFSRLEHYLKYQPDVLFVNFHDNLKTAISPEEANVPHISFENKCFLVYNLTQTTVKQWYEVKGGKNPFHTNVNELNTPARPFLFSKKAVNHDIFYDENMRLYDDFIVFIKCFEHSRLGNLNVYGMFDSDIYLYNSCFSNNATGSYFDSTNAQIAALHETENANFVKSLKNRFLTLKNWDLKLFPTLELDQMNEPDNFVCKYRFLCNIAKQIQLPAAVGSRDNIEKVVAFCKQNKIEILSSELQCIHLERCTFTPMNI